MTAQAIDDVLAGTFPASDPPAWTPGVARPAPDATLRPRAAVPSPPHTTYTRAGVLDVPGSSASEPTFARVLVTVIGAAGVALLMALALLVIGTPVALGVRGALELAVWVLAMIG